MAAPAYSVCLREQVVMGFHRIPPGCFEMGSRGHRAHEEPRHRVRIARPFYMGMHPVTQAEFAVWAREARGEHRNYFDGKPNHPAENLDWYEAIGFCRWLNVARGAELPAGHLATLPTEAEWEYACRAGTETEYHSGDGEAALGNAGWFSGNAGGSTHVVGGKAPNDFGLFDMHGNVWEWCWDAYDADAYRTRVDGVTDPGAAERWAALESEGALASREGYPDRVIRGGSWGLRRREVPLRVSPLVEARRPQRLPGLPGLSGSRSGARTGRNSGWRRSPAGRRGGVGRRAARAPGVARPAKGALSATRAAMTGGAGPPWIEVVECGFGFFNTRFPPTRNLRS